MSSYQNSTNQKLTSGRGVGLLLPRLLDIVRALPAHVGRGFVQDEPFSGVCFRWRGRHGRTTSGEQMTKIMPKVGQSFGLGVNSHFLLLQSVRRRSCWRWPDGSRRPRFYERSYTGGQTERPFSQLTAFFPIQRSQPIPTPRRPQRRCASTIPTSASLLLMHSLAREALF